VVLNVSKDYFLCKKTFLSLKRKKEKKKKERKEKKKRQSIPI